MSDLLMSCRGRNPTKYTGSIESLETWNATMKLDVHAIVEPFQAVHSLGSELRIPALELLQDWFNAFFGRLWPKIAKYAQKLTELADHHCFGYYDIRPRLGRQVGRRVTHRWASTQDHLPGGDGQGSFQSATHH